MRKSKRFEGMPVISLAEGQQIGTVKGMVVNPASKEVAALIIEQKGWFSEQKFVPYNKVRSVGSDAITIDQSNNVEKGTSLPEIVRLLKDKTEVVSTKVVSEEGTELGYVEEFFVDLETGQICGLEISGKFLSSVIKGKVFLDTSFVRTIGKEIIVTSNEAVDNVVKIDGGLHETVKNIKETTGSIWESTVQISKEIGHKTIELGSSLNKQLEKMKKEKPPEKTMPAAPADEPVEIPESEPVPQEATIQEDEAAALPVAAQVENTGPAEEEKNAPESVAAPAEEEKKE